MHLHRQSAYLIGKDRKVADIPVDHPSCSRQHAAFQYRAVEKQVQKHLLQDQDLRFGSVSLLRFAAVDNWRSYFVYHLFAIFLKKTCGPVDKTCVLQNVAFFHDLKQLGSRTVNRVVPYIIDLESSNGTYVNNQKIEPKRWECFLKFMRLHCEERGRLRRDGSSPWDVG